MKNLSELAVAYRCDYGISCIPCLPRQKEPSVAWKEFQNTPLEEDRVKELFRNHDGNIAFLMGKASQNLVCLDFDDQELFEQRKREFLSDYGPTAIVSSGRGGHIYGLTKEPVKGRKYTDEQGRSWEVRGQSQYVLAPPSVHPSGALYEFKSGLDTICKISGLPYCEFEFVRDDDTNVVHVAQADLNYSYPIERCMDYFKNRAAMKYKSDSEFDMAVITGLVNRKVPFEIILESFKRTKYPTHFEKLIKNGSLRVAEPYLKHSYEKACKLEHTSKYKETCNANAREVAAIRQAIIENPDWWRGRGKLMERDVLEAHIKQYEMCKKDAWNLDERTGAQYAECSAPTFRRSTSRLVGAGFILRVKSADRGKSLAASYEFGPKLQNIIKDAYTHNTTVCICNSNNITLPETYGVFERKIFGKACKQVYFTILKYGPFKTQQELLKKSGVSQSSLTKCLRKLQENSLITCMRNNYSIGSNKDFKKLSETHDSGSIQDKRRDKHQMDRARHQEVLRHRAAGRVSSRVDSEAPRSAAPAPTGHSERLLPPHPES